RPNSPLARDRCIPPRTSGSGDPGRPEGETMSMPPLAGVKVVEVAMWGFVPSAGLVLADWGAEVVKVEHPVHGDPMRGALTGGTLPVTVSGVNFMWELFNRGKRSVGIDLKSQQGREVLYRLVR